MGRFRISLGEVFIAVTAVCIGFALLLTATEVSAIACHTALLLLVLVALSVAAAVPGRRPMLLAFVMGVFAYQWMSVVGFEHDLSGKTLQGIWFLMARDPITGAPPQSLRGDSRVYPEFDTFLGIGRVEVSFAVGVLCAWIARSIVAVQPKSEHHGAKP